MKLRLILLFCLLSGAAFAQSPFYAPSISVAKQLGDQSRAGQLISVTDIQSPAQFRVIASKPAYATEDNYWYIKTSGNQWLQRIVDSTQAVTVTDTVSMRNATVKRLIFDGSQWEKKIGNQPSNGGTVVRVDANSYWERKYQFVTPEMFGAIPGDGSDDSQAIQRACSSFGNGPKGGVVVFDGRKTYEIANTIFVPYNVSFEGQFAIMKPISGGTFKDGFMFFLNAQISNYAYVRAYGGEIISNIRDLSFDNSVSNLSGIRGFFTKSKTSFFNITFTRFYQGIKKVGNQDEEFTDQLTFEKIYFLNSLGTDYLISILYHGDGLVVNQCHVAGVTTGNFNFLDLRSNSGGTISNCVNGNIRIVNSKAISVQNLHNEHGQIYIEASEVALKNIYQWKEFAHVPLTITYKDEDKRGYPCSIENYAIVYKNGQAWEDSVVAGQDFIDAYFRDQVVTISNFHRMQDGDILGIGKNSAPTVSIDGTTVWSEWEKNAPGYAKSSKIVSNKISSALDALYFPNGSFGYTVYNPIANNDASSKLPAGTHYYKYVLLFGPKDKLVGKPLNGGAEYSITTVAGKSVTANIVPHPDLYNGTLRIYRGDTTLRYNAYVDVPYMNGDKNFDKGDHMTSGHVWKSRASGNIETFNSNFTGFRKEATGAVTYWGTATPTSGSWSVGDRVINPSPAPNTTREWICTVAGSPGTWVPALFSATPELIGNKVFDFTTISNQLYPSIQAVRDHVLAKTQAPQPGAIAVTATADYVPTATDHTVLLDVTSGSRWVFLPPLNVSYSSGNKTGRILYIKKTDASANIVSVKPSGSETIGPSGALSLGLSTQYAYVRIQALADHWEILDQKP